MNRTSRLAGGLILAILWLLLVFLLFYSVQKPLGVTNLQAIFDSLLNIATAGSLLLLGTALGDRVLGRLPLSSFGERLLFSAGTGLGIISLATLSLGIFGLLYPAIFYGLGVVLSFFLWKDILGILRTIPRVLSSLTLPRLFSTYLAATLLVSLLAALTPAISFDSLMYHLTAPKLYLQSHRIFAFDELHFYFPSLVEMLFLGALLVKGEIAAQLIHFSFGLLLGAGLFIFAGQFFSPRAGWWSVALVWSMPLVPLILGWAYVDLALAFYELLSFWALVKWFDTLDRRFLALAGINAGWAMGVKYTAFVLSLALLLVILYNSRRHWHWSGRKILPSLLLFTIGAGIVASPWYLGNLYLVGNPIYPFFFDGKFWDGWLAQWFEQPGSGLGLDPGQLLALPLTATLGVRDLSFYDGRIGPLFLAFLPLLILGRVLPNGDPRRNRLWGYLLALFLGQFSFWTLGVIHSQSLFQARLLLPSLVFLSPALAYSLDQLAGLSHRLFSPSRLLNIVVGIVLALGLTTQALEYLSHDPLPYLVGWEMKEEYLERNLGEHYQAIQAVNQLSQESTIQFLWEPRTYYCARDCLPDPILGNFKHWVYLHRSEEGIFQELKRRGVTHLLVHEWGRNFLEENLRTALTSQEQEVWNELRAENLSEIYRDERGVYVLYVLR